MTIDNLKELNALEEHTGVRVEESDGDPLQKQVHLSNGLGAKAWIGELQPLIQTQSDDYAHNEQVSPR